MQILRWLLIFLSMSLLHGCGGGDTGSVLSPSQGSSTTTNGNTSTTPQTADVALLGQMIIPAGVGQMNLTVATFKQGTTEILPNVTMELSVNGSAKLNKTSVKTDSRGQASLIITDSMNENVLLTLRGVDGYQGGFTRTLYFGGTVTADVISQGITPADGKTAAQVVVAARDSSGVPIVGAPVDFSFPNDSFAAATSGDTDDKGQYIGAITNTVPQNTYVTPFAGGMAARTLPLSFGTSTVSVRPQSLDLIIKNNNVPADGKSSASVVVVARDSAGVPVSNVSVNISVNSATAVLSTNGKSGSVNIVGNTGTAGSFELGITNTVEETITLVAKMSVTDDAGSTSVVQCSLTSGSSTTTTTTTTTSDTCGNTSNSGIVFKNPSTTTPTGGTVITAVTLDEPIKNNSAKQGDDARANGADTVTVVGRVLGKSNNDEKEVPVTDVTVSILLSGGSADMKISNSGKTDGSGFFTVTFTDKVVETFSMRAVVGGVSSDKTEIKFTAIPVADPTTTTRVPVLTSVTLYASPTKQSANDKDEITLTALVLDETRTPMKDVDVVLSNDGSLVATGATISSGGKTGESGVISFKVKSKQVGKFTVSAVASVVSGGALKTVSSDAKVLEFINPIVDLVASIQLDVANNSQKIGDKINLVTIVRDQAGRALAGVPLFIKSEAEAIAEPSYGSTGANGQLSFTMTSSKAKSYLVTVEVEGTQSIAGKTSVSQIVTFVSNTGVPLDVNLTQPTVLNDNQVVSSDSAKGIDVRVTARDSTGKAVKGAAISVIVDGDLVATPANGVSGDNGVFATKLNSIKSGTYTVVFIVDGCQTAECRRSTTVHFTSGSPLDVNLTQPTVLNDNQPASSDSAKGIDVRVTARDSTGKAVKGAPISVIVDGEVVATPANGSSGDNGVFATKLNSTKPGTYTVVFVVDGCETAECRRTTTVTFLATSTGATVNLLELRVENNNQLADGKGKVVLIATAYDKKGGLALSGIEVSFIHTSLTAKLEKDSGTTNELGEFRTTIIDDVAENFQVTAVVKGSSAANLRATQTVTFLPLSTLQPKSIVLNALSNNRQVNEEVELVVIARDANNSPMSGVSIVFSTLTGDVLPDVSNSARFTSDMSKTDTDNTGSVKVKVTNNEPGTFKVKATVKGSSLSSEVTLTFNKSTTTQTPVDSLELLTSSPELKSEGDANGVIITARVKDSNNNLLADKKVTFTANSGAIQAVGKKNDAQAGVTYDPAAADAGVTDATGQAYARLTTTGDPANRQIEVKATSESKTTAITVSVIGTKIKITGSDAIVMGSESVLNISLTDSADKGIAAQVEVSADNGSLINGSSAPVVISTDNKGLAEVKLNAVNAGATTVTVKKVKDNKPREEDAISATWTINVSQDDFTIVASQTPDADGIYNLPISATSGSSGCLPPYIGCEPPQGAITFKVVWKSAGQPKQGGEVKLSTTRGTVTPQTGVTDSKGELTFAVTSETAGPGVVTATTSIANGPSKSISVYFAAQDVASMVLQAAPSTVGVNVSGGSEQQSKISALLRDKDGNVVKGKRIVFRVEDITGGSVSPSSAVSDAAGQASITYYAGGSPSATNGVTVYARVEGVNSIYCNDGRVNASECAVNLTVALKKVFITLGTGNQIGIHNVTTYAYPYTVLITDINGAPVKDEQVILSINTIGYGKGFLKWNGKTWQASYTIKPDFFCVTEDKNLNGLLDPGEDNNRDGILTPGNVATFAADSTSVVENNSIALKTDKDGLAAFNIIYPKNYAHWVVIQLIARSGESTAFNTISLAAVAGDMAAQEADPAGRVSPFGRGGPPADPDNSKIEDDTNYPNASCNNTL